jgi:GDP-mannose 6-dehydrogenase
VHPEFLREGQAVDDFFNPPKIVYGVTDEAARKVIPDIYPGIDAPTEIMTTDAAALVKYADNCFHALKVTFANEIGRLARSFSVDARDVMRVFCLDTKLNISTRYLKPGLPFGGSCLPKDVKAVNAWSRAAQIELPVLDELIASNHRQIESIVERLVALGGKSVAFFGLAFKDDTDDLRESPMLAMVEMLRGRGISCRAFDPLVDRKALESFGTAKPMLANVATWMADDAQALISSADVVVIARKKLGIDFASMDWPGRVTVFDLVGLDLRLPSNRVVGLYW